MVFWSNVYHWERNGAMHILDELRTTAARVAELEAASERALYDEGDRQAHRHHLVAKAELLAGLPQRVLPLAGTLPAGLADEIMAAVEEIGADARQAWRWTRFSTWPPCCTRWTRGCPTNSPRSSSG